MNILISVLCYNTGYVILFYLSKKAYNINLYNSRKNEKNTHTIRSGKVKHVQKKFKKYQQQQTCLVKYTSYMLNI